MRLHLCWWLASFWPGKHPGAPVRPGRLLFLLLGYPLFFVLQVLHWLGFALDALFFGGYRKVGIESPVFILGIPRSGTTFLHRTLAADPSYTSFTTWEAALAPSITERKLIGLISRLDRAFGAPGRRLLKFCLNRSKGNFDAIHEVDLSAPEEDYLSLLPAGACFILLLAFPFSTELAALARLDQLPEDRRRAILRFYKSCLQRHLYCHRGKRLLSKNAAFASWCSALREAFPDAKFLVCIREPERALSSQLSSLAPARRLFGTDPDGKQTAARFTGIYAHTYQSLARFVTSTEREQTAVICQNKLRAGPAGTIRAALHALSLAMPPGLEELQPAPSSSHQHTLSEFSIDTEKIERCMRPAYESMLEVD